VLYDDSLIWGYPLEKNLGRYILIFLAINGFVTIRSLILETIGKALFSDMM